MATNNGSDRNEADPIRIHDTPNSGRAGHPGSARPGYERSLDCTSLYIGSQNLIRQLLNAPATMTPVIQIGAVTMGPWSALKSLLPTSMVSPYAAGSSIFCRTKILSIVNGFGGDHFVRLAESFGDLLSISELAFPFNAPIDLSSVCSAARAFRPEIITVVHCEVATGMINSDEVMAGIGQIAAEVHALYVIDVISSAGSTAIDLGRWKADIACLGVEQTLGLPPVLSIVMVSERAWNRIDQVKYYGYDSLLEWRYAYKHRDHAFPYKHWQPGLLELYQSLQRLLSDNHLIERHARARDYVIERGKALGLELFVSSPTCSSPTGTVFKVPAEICGTEFRCTLLSNFDVDVGHPLEHFGDRLFRIAHMGFDETDLKLLQSAMNAVESTLNELSNNRNTSHRYRKS